MLPLVAIDIAKVRWHSKNVLHPVLAYHPNEAAKNLRCHTKRVSNKYRPGVRYIQEEPRLNRSSARLPESFALCLGYRHCLSLLIAYCHRW